MSIDQRIREGLRTTNDELPLPDVQQALTAVTAGGRPAQRRHLVAALAAAAVAAAVAVVVGPNLSDDSAPPPVTPNPTPSLVPPSTDGSIYFAAEGSAGDALTDPRSYFEVETDPQPMDIYLSRQGQKVRRVIATGAHERCPAVSPDGTRLAYLAGASVVIAPLDAAGNVGAAEVRVDLEPPGLYRPENAAGPACPQWSPDGRQLGYLLGGYDADGFVESLDDPLTAEVHAVTLTGQDRVLVAFDRMAWDSPVFAWSPDGDEVAYTTTEGVWRARQDGGAPELVWRTPQGHLQGAQRESLDGPISLAWSSQDELAFTVSTFNPTEPNNPMSGGFDSRKVVVIDAGSGRVQLEADAGSVLEGGAGEAWSPDGSLLVFTGPDRRILLHDRASGSTTRLRLPFEGADGDGYAPMWSPDGQELLARVNINDRGFALVSFALDGSSSEVRTPWTWALDWASLDDVAWSGR